MEEQTLEVNPWFRFGKARLYLKDGEQSIGWFDLNDGSANEVPAEYRIRFDETVDSWLEARPKARAKLQEALAAADNEGEQVEAEVVKAPIEEVESPPDNGEDSYEQPLLEEDPELLGPLEESHLSEEELADAGEPTTDLAEEIIALPRIDLVRNVAGQSARQQQHFLKSSSPVKSFFARLIDVKTEERNWRLGAEGEELVAKEIAKLQQRDPRWRVIHDLRVGKRGANIDHILVGPPGIFVIDAKHWPNAAVKVYRSGPWIDGKKAWKDFNGVRKQAVLASNILSSATGMSISAMPILAFVNPASFQVKDQPEDVIITYRKNLIKALSNYPEKITDSQIETIFEAMRQPQTWKSP